MTGLLVQASFWKAAAMMATIVITSSAGEVLTAAAMKSMGDLDVIRAKSGLGGAIKAVVTSPLFMGGIFFMAVAFFSLLFALNHMNLSLVGPALLGSRRTALKSRIGLFGLGRIATRQAARRVHRDS